MLTLNEPVERLSVGLTHVTGSWRDVAFICWHGPTSVLILNEQMRLVSEWGSQLRDGFALFVEVGPEMPLPDEATRSEWVRWLAYLAPQLRCGGVIILEQGFGAAAQRAVVAGINAQVTRPFPNDIFSTREAAAGFAVSNLGYELASAATFVAAIEHLHAAS